MKGHWDTIAIVGVNLAVAALLMALCISNSNRMDAANARMDAANARMDTMHVMIYDVINSRK